MICENCGGEIKSDVRQCSKCSSLVYSGSDRISSVTKIIIFSIMFFVVGLYGLFIVIAYPDFVSRNHNMLISCESQLFAISQGLQMYLTENNDFSKLTENVGDGDDICNYIMNGYDTPAGCVGRVRQKVKSDCVDYNIAIEHSEFKYEIRGHSRDMWHCGLCITESGYCPQKGYGVESEGSPCMKTCEQAGYNSTAICLH